MIYSELKNYLTQSTSVETIRMVDRAVSVFQSLDQDSDFMLTYDTVVGNAIDSFDDVVVDSILNITRELVDDVLKQHSIYLVEAATLSDALDVAEALMLLQNWENKAEIEIILDTDGNHLEKLSGLIAMVHGSSVENYMSLIEHFNPRLITKIREELLQPFEEQLVDIKEIEQNLIDYQKVKKVFSEPNEIDKLLKQPGTIGQPFEIYLTLWAEHNLKYLGEEFTPNYTRLVAIDMLLLSALSKQGLSKVQQNVRNNSALITGDLNNITKLDAAITQVFLEVSRAQV